MDAPKQIEDAKKSKFVCFSCNKHFKDNDHLKRHKNRKTPCVIRAVAPQDVGNPLLCIFCNKIFAHTSNLTRHHKTCKIKNGGMQMLADKTRHEQPLQSDTSMRVFDMCAQELAEIKARMATLELENAKLKEAIGNANTPVATAVNNTTVNNITFNCYTRPNLRHLIARDDRGAVRFLDILRQHMVQTPVALVDEIWFNPEVPGNLTVFLVNKSTRETLVYDGMHWRVTDAATAATQLREKCYDITARLGVIGDSAVVAQIRDNRQHREVTDLEIAQIQCMIYAGREKVRHHNGKITASCAMAPMYFRA